jgi:hypothetical protein
MLNNKPIKMKRISFISLIILLLICTTVCFAGSVVTIPANDQAIEFTGRIDFTNPQAPKFSYSGVSIRACFSGTSIAAIMDDDTGQNYYNIILDGKMLDTLRIGVGKKTYNLAQGLENSVHEIEIFKRTEQMFGKTQFFGFVVDGGTTLSAIVHKRDKLIEFIGNSITCGYGNEGVNGGVFGPTTENHYLTYAAITSRNFNARHLAVCKSGIGIYRNYDGPAAGNTDCMTNYYTRTFLYDENPKYSFAEKPDLVCIDLGTNDFSTSGCDSAKFVTNYLRLIDTIQTKYSMPDIVCLLGPMLSGSSLTLCRRYLNAISNRANLKGKGNVSVFEMSAQTGDLGIAIDYHPTVAQHKRNAQELTTYIKSIKGWKVEPLVITASVIGTKHIQIEFNTLVKDDLNNFSGFVVKGGDGLIVEQTSAYIDSTNNKIVHLLLKKNFIVGEKISLSYVPGTIESEDSILVWAINDLNVLNTLTETTVKKGTISSDGATMALTFNKKIKKATTLDGFTFINSKGAMAIDSFQVTNTLMTIYLKEKIVKGDSVFASYSGTTIYGDDEIALSSFTRLVVKNGSKYTSVSIDKQGSIEIYPNPNSSGKFYYSINQSEVSKDSRLEVYSTNGALVYNQNLSGLKGMIDLNEKMTKGIYIIKFTLGESVVTKSVVKE